MHSWSQIAIRGDLNKQLAPRHQTLKRHDAVLLRGSQQRGHDVVCFEVELSPINFVCRLQAFEFFREDRKLFLQSAMT
jgi:hypothetical protein